MYLVVGLGNPGREYAGTRHNIGFEVVDALAERAGVRFSDRKFKGRLARARVGGEDSLLLEPMTYMNLSGESVGPCLVFYKLTTAELIVLHDDLDLEVGRIKIKKGGGHGGHNGLRSLAVHLPDRDYVRVRIGVGRPPPRWDPADYVLARFMDEERPKMDEVVDEAAKAVAAIIRLGTPKAMSRFNRTEKKKSAKKRADEGKSEGTEEDKEPLDSAGSLRESGEGHGHDTQGI